MIELGSNLGTLQRAIELFGTPQSILVVHTQFFDQVTLLNSQRGIAFGYTLYGAQSVDSSSIGPGTEISGVTFFDPSQYQKVLKSGILCDCRLSAGQIIANLRPWTGYGSFKDKYWPPATEPPQ